jgi:hypothetical protein
MPRRPFQLHLHLPPMLRIRIEQAAKDLGVTMTSIAIDGIEAEVKRRECEIVEFKEARAKRRGRAPSTMPPPMVALRSSRPPSAAEKPSTVERDADYILAGKGDAEQERRAVEVAERIKRESKTREQATAAAEALDAAIRKRMGH